VGRLIGFLNHIIGQREESTRVIRSESGNGGLFSNRDAGVHCLGRDTTAHEALPSPGAVPQAGRLRPNRLAVRSSITHLLESRLNRAEVLEYTQFLRFSEKVGTYPSSPEFTFFFL
jgi:hypothetical protein